MLFATKNPVSFTRGYWGTQWRASPLSYSQSGLPPACVLQPSSFRGPPSRRPRAEIIRYRNNFYSHLCLLTHPVSDCRSCWILCWNEIVTTQITWTYHTTEVFFLHLERNLYNTKSLEVWIVTSAFFHFSIGGFCNEVIVFIVVHKRKEEKNW